MNLKIPNLKNLFKDKNVLYVVFILAILNILGYLLVQNIEAVVFFLVVGFLTTYFSKNMTIVLMVSIIATSLFTSTRPKRVREGMDNKKGVSDKKTKEVNASVDKSKKNTDSDNEDSGDDNSDDNGDDNDDDDKPTEGMAVSSGKKKGHFVSHADNLQNAFAQLNKTVGKDGIEGLTGQTGKLIQQQENLMKNIEGMKPFLDTAQSFMDKIDLSGLDNIGGMLSKFGGGDGK